MRLALANVCIKRITKMHKMTNDELRRESVIKDVITIFIDVIGFLSDDEKKRVNRDTHIINDFKMQDCDFLVFNMDLDKHFFIKMNNEDWEQAILVGEVADVIIKKMNENP